MQRTGKAATAFMWPFCLHCPAPGGKNGPNVLCRALKQWSHPEEPSEAPPQQPVPPGALETEASAGAAGAQRHNRRHAFAGRIKFALRQLTSREPASGDGGGATDAGISPIFVDPNQARVHRQTAIVS